jgi:uncharacterized cupredoxin-like copper-binding protein
MFVGASRQIAAFSVLFALVLSACSSSPAAPSGSTTTLMVMMSDKDITLSTAEVPAGLVTFMVMNRGTIVHSLVVIRTDVADNKMPLDPADESKVNETGSIAASGQMAVGSAKQIQRQLTPGKYVLVCNEPAHYAVGMHTGLVVK